MGEGEPAKETQKEQPVKSALLYPLGLRRVVLNGSQMKSVSGSQGVIRGVLNPTEILSKMKSKMNTRNGMDLPALWTAGPSVTLTSVDHWRQKLRQRSLRTGGGVRTAGMSNS